LDPIQALKSAGPNSSAGRGDRRLLRGVTVIQTALTLALLVGAGLLIRTMRNIAQAPSGYDTGRILTMSVTMVQGDWSEFHRRALERVSAIAGVQSAAFAWGVPLTGNNWPVPVDIEGRPAASKASDQLTLPLRSVTPGYFNLLGLTILDGRDFRSTDARKRAQYYWVIKEHSDVELFCGITPLRARPTRETLRGIYKGPGERRGACRPARTLDELLQGIVVTR
jgi:putative ABC transport system permease protein